MSDELHPDITAAMKAAVPRILDELTSRLRRPLSPRDLMAVATAVSKALSEGLRIISIRLPTRSRIRGPIFMAADGNGASRDRVRG